MLGLIAVTLEESTNAENSMRIHAMFVLLLITGYFIDYISCTFIKSRTWHEEFVELRQGQHPNILYPRYKICRAPREKPEQIKPRSVQSNIKTAEVSWAELLTIYSADSGSEIYNWDYWKKEVDPDKATRLDQFISIVRFTTVVLLIFTVFIAIIPTLGRCGFKFYSLIWLVIFHPEVRRICRRIFIMKEKISRKHMQLLIPKTGDRGQLKKKQFRLPFILREYNEEEVPAELMLSGDEDTDGEISSDGFENLLIRTKSRGVGQNKAVAKNLVNLMARTEEELADTETDNVFMESTAGSKNRPSFIHHIRTKSISKKH